MARRLGCCCRRDPAVTVCLLLSALPVTCRSVTELSVFSNGAVLEGEGLGCQLCDTPESEEAIVDTLSV
jgi:hypothetical protein